MLNKKLYSIKHNLVIGENVEHHIVHGKDSGLFNTGMPDTIILHYTASDTKVSAIRTLSHKDIKASAHVVVDRDGSITQLIPFDKIAWHAGSSSWFSRKNMNNYSIGIEIVNAGKLLDRNNGRYQAWFRKTYSESEVFKHSSGFWHNYTESQIDAVYGLCERLVVQLGVHTILGHEDVSPGRKMDPGPAFPLDTLQKLLTDKME